MSRLFLILLFVCVVSATRCIVNDKDEPEVHVIRLGSLSGESDQSEVVTLDLPDRRRKRQADRLCKNENPCPAGHICIPYLGCVKGHLKNALPKKVVTPRSHVLATPVD
ncbi:uncharacterized protein LOC143371614 [Andrena cerasifolii]|uniref:uncharacterized protein LOC143371614 n=1 Tax=Andrena cerasifolii TaxID=2819439 RepID=UPI0040380557